MSIFLGHCWCWIYIKLSSDEYIFCFVCATGRFRIGVGWTGGRAPRSLDALYIKLSSDVLISLLFLTLARHELVWGPGGGAPRSSDALKLNYLQMCLFLYLFCDTGRSRIGVECTGGGA